MQDVSQDVSAPAPKKKLGIVKWALIVGIAVVINLFLVYLVDSIRKEPGYTDFCPERQVNRMIESEAECLKVGGQWNESADVRIQKTPEQSFPAPAVPSYCDPDYTCRKQHEDALKIYNRNVFVIFVIAGIMLLIAGVYAGGTEAVSLGLSFGGVIALIYGSGRYWSDMNDILRVIVLGMALVALIYVAWKKFQD